MDKSETKNLEKPPLSPDEDENRYEEILNEAQEDVMNEGEEEKGFQNLLDNVVKITDKSDDEMLPGEIESKTGELDYSIEGG